MADDAKTPTPAEKARDLSGVALAYAPMFGPLGELVAVVAHDLLDEHVEKEKAATTKKEEPCRKEGA